jgi:glycine/sarcosine N-methyltransferase
MSHTAFYDGLAPYYHLLYADWDASIARQGAALAAVLEEAGVLPGARVLDAACGVGTQTLGLAARGYRMTASDLSPIAVERCAAEAAARRYSIETKVADLRRLSHVHHEPAAAVLACDNAIPHLLTDDEILGALRECHRCTAPGGIVIFSVRDYAVLTRRSPDVHPYGVRNEGEVRYLAWQVWDWDADGERYGVSLYLVEDRGGAECQTRVFRSRYYAVTIDRLLVLMAEAGFILARRIDGVFFQPLVVAHRSS